MTDRRAARAADPSADALTTALRQPPPASVSALPDEERDRLAALIVATRRRTEREGAEAADRAIHAVPGPLRELVKKALS